MNLDALKAVTTRQLLQEVSVRLRTTQNSIAGLDLADMCDTAVAKLNSGVLNYVVERADPDDDRWRDLG